MDTRYTHAVTFYKKDSNQGWTFHSFRTTEDALNSHITQLRNQQSKGTVRLIDTIKLKDPQPQ